MHNTPTRELTIFHELIHRWQSKAAIDKIVSLKADASMRQYFRIYLDSGDRIIGMLFDSVKAAEAESEQRLPADEAYYQLTSYF